MGGLCVVLDNLDHIDVPLLEVLVRNAVWRDDDKLLVAIHFRGVQDKAKGDTAIDLHENHLGISECQ